MFRCKNGVHFLLDFFFTFHTITRSSILAWSYVSEFQSPSQFYFFLLTGIAIDLSMCHCFAQSNSNFLKKFPVDNLSYPFTLILNTFSASLLHSFIMSFTIFFLPFQNRHLLFSCFSSLFVLAICRDSVSHFKCSLRNHTTII